MRNLYGISLYLKSWICLIGMSQAFLPLCSMCLPMWNRYILVFPLPLFIIRTSITHDESARAGIADILTRQHNSNTENPASCTPCTPATALPRNPYPKG